MNFKIISKNETIILNAKSVEDARTIAINEYGILPSKIENISNKKRFLFRKKVSQKELEFVFLQFKIMLESSVPLNICLESIRDSLLPKGILRSKSPLYEAFDSIIFLVSSGQSLSFAFSYHKNIFDPLVCSIIQVGEQSGCLEASFSKLYDIAQNQNTQNAKIQKSLIYPTSVFVSMCVAFFIILRFVIPEFENIFISFGKELPIYTQILLYINSFIEHFGILLLLGFITLIFSIKSLHSFSSKFAFLLDRFSLKIPFYKNIILLTQSYNFLFSLSILLSSQVPLDQSVKIAKNSVKNTFLKSKIDIILDVILSGGSLSDALNKSNFIDNITLRLISSGEKSGSVAKMLDISHTRLKNMADSKINNAIIILEPTMSVVLGLMLLFLALGVFVPMWDLSSI